MSVTKADRTVALDAYGPGSDATASLDDARLWCERLTRAHGENFTVLSSLVPSDRRRAFAAVYAYCRCADDLGDEAGSSERASALLVWWRRELGRCFEGEASHPVFVALRPEIDRWRLPIAPFADLISAFEMDQSVRRYSSWDELLGYCRLSADPVGRLVLGVLEGDCTPDALAASDEICTALQLTNHWQDVRRDFLERDRIYLPSDAWQGERFEERLASTCRVGHAPDREFLEEYRRTVRSLVERTWPLYERGTRLLEQVHPDHRGVIWLFLQGGARTLREIELWNYETCVSRPRLSMLARLSLLLRARTGIGMSAGVPRW
jgi:squalene synthase HpnC